MTRTDATPAGPTNGVWLPLQGRGLVFITDDLAAAIHDAQAREVEAAVLAERLRILVDLRHQFVDCELGPVVLERTVVAVVNGAPS